MLSKLSKEYKDKLEFIKNHFGIDSQHKKLIEEIEELETEFSNIRTEHFAKALPKILHNEIDINNILEEIADCYIVAMQIGKNLFLDRIITYMFAFYFNAEITLMTKFRFDMNVQILEIARQKIDRTLERIESGYYEKRL